MRLGEPLLCGVVMQLGHGLSGRAGLACFLFSYQERQDYRHFLIVF